MTEIRDRKRNKQLVSLIEENSSEWLRKVPAVLGDLEGHVESGVGLVFARLSNGYVVEAINYIAPLIFDLQVIIGQSKSMQGIWQVISVRETYPSPASNFVKYHHEQHEFPGPDTVWVDRKQILPLTILVTDGAAFTVRVFGNVAQTATGIQLIDTQDIDLSSYVPTAGAKYVSFEVDDDGIISVHDGVEVGSFELLTETDIPVPEPGKYFLGYAMLFETQTELTNDHIRVAFPLGVIPNFPNFIFDDDEGDPADTTAGFPEDGTSAFSARRDHVHHAEIDHVHGLDRWNGSSGQTDFDLSEIALEIESVILDGLEEDPLVYTLSSDGTQIILDTGLASDMTVIAHYRIQGI
jgi:hypothetical protein